MSVWKRLTPAWILTGLVVVVSMMIRDDLVWLDTSVIIATYSLLALSLGMTWGQAGILSLAQGAFAAIGAYSAAIVTVTWEGSIWWGLAGALVIPPLVAYPMARLTVRLTPLALAIATLAFGEVLYTLLREGGDLTGGYIGLPGVPQLGFAETQFAFHVFAWALVLLVVVIYCNLRSSPWGTALRTVRNDHVRARADGIDVSHASGAIFALSASVAGLSGWLYAHYLSYVAPESLGTALSITVVLMAFIGGANHVLGPILGAVLLTLLQDNIGGAEEARGLIYGALVVVVILLAPSGILGARLPRWTRRSDSAGHSTPPATSNQDTESRDASDANR